MTSDRRRNLGLVAAGGMIGTGLRVGLGEVFPRPEAAFPTTTLLVNWVGCFLLGALFALIDGDSTKARRWRAFLGIGLLGSFTTFSTFALETDRLLGASRPAVSLGYVVASVVGGLVLAAAGLWVGRFRRSPGT